MADTDPDALLSYAEISEYAATKGATISASSLRSYRAKGLLPPPDDTRYPRVPRWRRSTIDRWLKDRATKGRRSDLKGPKAW